MFALYTISLFLIPVIRNVHIYYECSFLYVQIKKTPEKYVHYPHACHVKTVLYQKCIGLLSECHLIILSAQKRYMMLSIDYFLSLQIIHK